MLPVQALAFSAAQPVGQAGAWNMIFEDNFDGTSLDLSRWRPNWLSGSDTSTTPPINSLEKNCYSPSNVSVTGGSLILTAKPNTLANCVDRTGAKAAYSSGLIESRGKLGGDFTYGYVEARIQNPAGPDHKSFWPAFWTDGSGLNWPKTGEIDIMECYGVDASCSYHYHYLGGDPGGLSTVAGSTSSYHTYAAHWEPGKITWFYDGKQVWVHTTGIITVPHFIVANLGVIGTLGATPASMKVDYIRVWQKSISTTPLLSQTLLGDANHDQVVDGIDYLVWLTNYDPANTIAGGATIGDFDDSGTVDSQDYTVWLANFHR